MSEENVRIEACRWLKEHYPSRNYYLPPIVFHDVGLTITEFLHKKFKGEQLTCIPRYNDLPIRPDIISIIKLRKNEDSIMEWIIGECKVGKINSSDFRQAVHYANVSQAYEGYLFYSGSLSKEVEDSIKTGGHLFQGTNRWGRPVKKRLMLVNYKNGRFCKNML